MRTAPFSRRSVVLATIAALVWTLLGPLSGAWLPPVARVVDLPAALCGDRAHLPPIRVVLAGDGSPVPAAPWQTDGHCAWCGSVSQQIPGSAMPALAAPAGEDIRPMVAPPVWSGVHAVLARLPRGPPSIAA